MIQGRAVPSHIIRLKLGDRHVCGDVFGEPGVKLLILLDLQKELVALNQVNQVFGERVTLAIVGALEKIFLLQRAHRKVIDGPRDVVRWHSHTLLLTHAAAEHIHSQAHLIGGFTDGTLDGLQECLGVGGVEAKHTATVCLVSPGLKLYTLYRQIRDRRAADEAMRDSTPPTPPPSRKPTHSPARRGAPTPGIRSTTEPP